MNRLAYSKYKDSGVPWLGEVPEGWEVKRLRHLLSESLKYGANESTELEDPDLPRYVRITDIDNNGNLRDETFRSLPEAIAAPYLLRDGDILFARSGATFGKTFLYRESWGRCAYAGYLIRARIDHRKAHPTFVKYFVSSANYWQWLLSSYIQATIQNVSAEKYADLWLYVPPLSEQAAITSFLDHEIGRLDNLTAKKRELIARLKEKRTALVSRTVTRGLPDDVARGYGLAPHTRFRDSGIEWLGEVPEGWEVKKMSWLFSYSKGRNAATLTKEYIADNSGEFPVFSGQTGNNGLMGMIDQYEFEFSSPVLFVTTVGALAMSTRLVDGKFSLSQNCALIIPRSIITNAAYFLGVLQRLFDFERRSISLIMQPSLRFEDLNRFWIPVPPEQEQDAIAAYLYCETGKLDQLVAKVEAAIECLQEYRTALISAAVTGKIDVRKEAA